MASIDGKEKHDAFDSRMEEKNHPLPKQVLKTAPVASSSNSNGKKQPQAQIKGKGKAPGTKPYSQGYKIPKIQQDAMENNLVPSMGQALLKEVPKIKEWPHCSGEGEYDHMEFIRGIDMIKNNFELPDRSVTARFKTLFTRAVQIWYIKLRQAHGHQSWTWWKTQIVNKWANDSWRFKIEKAFESAQFNSDKYKALPWFCQQKDRLTALYPDMSEFIIHTEVLRQCGGNLEHSVKRRTTEQSSAEDIINILEEVTTRTRIGCSRVNLKTRFNIPWKDSVYKNPKENSNNIKYKSAGVMRKLHIFQSTTYLANILPKKGKINEIDIEKDEANEDNSDDK
ncbi:hypothetical protein O181_098866 [Austropuccinia psidii MF-1]|uniref:Uncharacterized protein n=1 Tax=Austropuccinia psidii MF-1 TaxID=1389203 RepID=A0A9Q3JBS9_9BASI|nr:hypothetical protein [Austropuccinia psidii MF-1]